MAMFEWPCPYMAIMRGGPSRLVRYRTQQHFSCLRVTVGWPAGAGAPLSDPPDKSTPAKGGWGIVCRPSPSCQLQPCASPPGWCSTGPLRSVRPPYEENGSAQCQRPIPRALSEADRAVFVEDAAVI